MFYRFVLIPTMYIMVALTKNQICWISQLFSQRFKNSFSHFLNGARILSTIDNITSEENEVVVTSGNAL